MKFKFKLWMKIALVILGLLLLAVTASVVYVKQVIVKPILEADGDEQKLPVLFGGKPVNILVVGSDQRGTEISRSDTLQLYHFDPRDISINLLSIPRDTYVHIPGHGMDKINHAYAFGGIDLSKRTVSEFLGVPVDRTMEMNFEGFKKIIDKMGGITVDVEKDINGDVNIKKGLQRLNGEQALAYVRDRHDPMGDIDRVKRQQKFLRAVAEEIKGYDSKYKLVPDIPEMYSNITTDITLQEVVQLYILVPWMKYSDDKIDAVPGDFMNLNGISYWKPDMKETKARVQKVFYSDNVISEGGIIQNQLPQNPDSGTGADSNQGQPATEAGTSTAATPKPPD